MPGFDDSFSVFFCKLLRTCKISDLEAVGFAQLYPVLNFKNCFSSGFPNMDVNRSMIIAVESEFEAIFFEDNRHALSVVQVATARDTFL